MNRSETPIDPHRQVSSWPLWLAGLLLLVTVLNWPAMTAPLLLDDNDGRAFSSGFQSWKEAFGPDSFGLFRPVKNLVFYAFNRQPEINLQVWHGSVLACFLGATAATFFLSRQLLRSDLWGLVAAAFWALTPTQTSTAIWMSCINISVSVVFLAAFLLLHSKAMSRPRPRPLGLSGLVAAMLMFLSQVCYETCIAAVGLAFILDHFVSSRPAWRVRIPHYALYTLVTLAFLLMRRQFGSSGTNEGINFGFSPDLEKWQLAASGPWFLFKHLQMWIAPVGRIEFVSTYVWGESAPLWQVGLAWLVVLTVVVAAWLVRRKLPLVAFGIFWFFLAAFPSSNLLPIFAGPIEDYYLTIPSVGLAIAVVAGIAAAVTRFRTSGNRKVAFAITAGALAVWRLFYIPFCLIQADLWTRPVDLYLSCDASRPLQFQAKTLAAREYFLAGDNEMALELSAVAAETAPWYPVGSMMYGYALTKDGRPLEALPHFEQAIRTCKPMSPQDQACQVEVAKIHIAVTGKLEEARERLLPVLERGLDDYRIPAIHAMTKLYLAEGNRDKAIATLAKGQGIYPDEPSFAEHLNSIQGPQARQE